MYLQKVYATIDCNVIEHSIAFNPFSQWRIKRLRKHGTLRNFNFAPLRLISAYPARMHLFSLAIAPLPNAGFAVKVNATTIAVGFVVCKLTFVYAVLVLHSSDSLYEAVGVKLAYNLGISFANAYWKLIVNFLLRVLNNVSYRKWTELVPHLVCFRHTTRLRLFVKQFLQGIWKSFRIK